MAGGSTNLLWNLNVNPTQYVSGMKKASASTEALYKATKKAQREQELMGKAAGLVGVAVAVAFGKKIVNAASDVNETMSKTSVVFGKSATGIKSWAASSAKSMGMSQRVAAESAASFGNLFVSMGTAQDKAAGMSTNLVQLASDLASFNNVDPATALDALRSGLVGETEPLRKFGVNLNDADLRQKALAMGLTTTTKSVLPPAIKAQAAYALILEQTKTAQGDFARTSDGYANSQRILTATWEDAQAKLGEGLVPTMTSAAQGLTGFLDAVNELSPSSRTAVLGIAGIGVAAAVAAPRVMALNTALAANGKSLKGMVGAGGPYVLAAAAIVGLGLAAHDSLDDLKAYDKLLEDLGPKAPGVAQIGAMQDRIRELQDTLADPGPLRMIRTGWEWLLGIPNEADLTADQLVAATQKYARFQAAVSAVAWELKIPLSEAQDRVAKSGIDLSGTSAQVVARFKEYERTSAAIAGTTSSAADAWHTATGEAKSFKQAMDDLNGSARSLTGSKIALIEKTKDLAKGLRESHGGFTLSTKAGRENLSNLIEVTTGIEDMGAAMEANGAPREKVIAAMQREKDALIDNIAKMTGSRERAKDLVNKYLKIPKAADDATESVKGLSKAVDGVPKSKTVTFKVTAQMTSAGAKALAIDARDGKRGATGWDGSSGSKVLFPASGGLIRGPGSGTSDSIPAMVSNGEFVMRASAVKRYGPEFFHSLNFADGGLVDKGFAHGRKRGGKSSSKSRTRSAAKASSGRDWSIRDALRDGAALDFDFSAYGSAVEAAAAATRDLADADRGVAEARRKANAAGTPAERAEAERELADAYAAQAAAGKELANAEKAKAAAKPTGRNILAGFRSRAAKLDRFRRDLKTLRGWGLSGVILKQLLDAGIDDGGDMAAALVKDRSVIADLNKTQAAINADARALNGPGSTGSGGGGGSTGSSGTTGSSGSVAITFANAERPIVLKVDGEQVWKSLLHLKKAKGGASLGLG